MKDSLVTAIIPLSSNRELRDRYLAASGQLRAGRLLEDTDIFAGTDSINDIKIRLNIILQFMLNMCGICHFVLMVNSLRCIQPVEKSKIGGRRGKSSTRCSHWLYRYNSINARFN